MTCCISLHMLWTTGRKCLSYISLIENTHMFLPLLRGLWPAGSEMVPLFPQIGPAEWDYVSFLSLSRAKVKHCLKKKKWFPNYKSHLRYYKQQCYSTINETLPSQAELFRLGLCPLQPSALLLASELTSFLSVKHSNRWNYLGHVHHIWRLKTKTTNQPRKISPRFACCVCHPCCPGQMSGLPLGIFVSWRTEPRGGRVGRDTSALPSWL